MRFNLKRMEKFEPSYILLLIYLSRQLLLSNRFNCFKMSKIENFYSGLTSNLSIFSLETKYYSIEIQLKNEVRGILENILYYRRNYNSIRQRNIICFKESKKVTFNFFLFQYRLLLRVCP